MRLVRANQSNCYLTTRANEPGLSLNSVTHTNKTHAKQFLERENNVHTACSLYDKSQLTVLLGTNGKEAREVHLRQTGRIPTRDTTTFQRQDSVTIATESDSRNPPESKLDAEIWDLEYVIFSKNADHKLSLYSYWL